MRTPSVRAAWAAWCVGALSGWAPGNGLNERIESIVAAARLGDGVVGISVVDAQTGESLAARQASMPMIPASNMKLLTTGTAVRVLGRDFEFRTTLAGDGDRLVVLGSGDPALADPVLLSELEPRRTVGDVIELLASAARAHAGDGTPVREVIIDDRAFDRQFVHPGWPEDQLNQGYCAEVAGINFHRNVLYVFPRPSPAGEGRPAVLSVQPEAPWLEIEVKARTVLRGSNSVWLTRPREENRFTLFGDVRTPSQSPVPVTVHDPPRFLGEVLAWHLEQSGTLVADPQRVPEPARQGAARLVRRPGAEESFAGATPLAVVRTPLGEILGRCNAESQNLYAEALLKRVGHHVTGQPGSWENGASAVRMSVTELLGPSHAASTVISDGSGLSRQNRVTPGTMTAWLAAMARSPQDGAAFIESLADLGEGTLSHRFRDARPKNTLHAKSGTISGVRCLSGYLTAPETGRRIAFSIMINNLPSGEPTFAAVKLQEDVVLALDRWLTEVESTQARVGG